MLCGILLCVAPPAHADIGIRGLGFLNPTDPTRVSGISADGSVVLGTSGQGTVKPLYWTVDPTIQLHQIPTASPMMTWSYGVPISASANGSTILVLQQGATNLGFRFAGGVTQSLPTPAGTYTIRPRTLSLDGSSVVGSASFTGGVGERAMRWDNLSPATQLGQPPSTTDSSAIVTAPDGSIIGEAGNTNTNYAALVRWNAGNPTTLATLPRSATVSAGPEFISTNGAIIAGVTEYINSSAGEDTWLWSASTGFHTLPPLAGNASFLLSGMNGDASIVVGKNDTFSPTPTAIIWTPALGTQTLAAYFAAAGVNLQGWTLDDFPVVSADGTRFAGTGIDPSGREEAYLVTIPSPSAAPALLAAFALARRRRRVR